VISFDGLPLEGVWLKGQPSMAENATSEADRVSILTLRGVSNDKGKSPGFVVAIALCQVKTRNGLPSMTCSRRRGRPRMHLTRFHGVFAPHSRLRAVVTPAHRGVGSAQQPGAAAATPVAPRHVAMNWARRLKRVFGIEIEGCARCGGKLRILASIEEPEVIANILSHLERTAPEQYGAELPLGARAPPVQSRLL